MNTEVLSKIGLTEGEIKVYLALLRLGRTTAGPIVKEAGVARSKLYEILDRLSKKGLVSHSVKNGTKYFSVAEPSRILDFLNKKEAEIKEQKEKVSEILPALLQEYELQSVKKEAEVFEGLEGLKNVREKYVNKMKKGDIIYFIGVPGSAYDKLEAYYKDWNEKRIKKGIKSYTLFTEDARMHSYVKEKRGHKNTYLKFLPKELIAYSWMEIYEDTVVIAINHKQQMSIVIQNKFVAETYKNQFRLLWKIAKD
ncbi:MAG: TrmB family transcriptional regulator [Candidatus Nanoarchaeia archaeon]